MLCTDFRSRPVQILILLVLVATAMTADADKAADRLLKTHAKNKQQVLDQLQRMSQLALTKRFGTDFRDAWRRILLDASFDGVDKGTFLAGAMETSDGASDVLDRALRSLLESHRKLFGSKANSSLMVRYAGDPTFKPFGRHMTWPEALAEMTEGNDAEVQAFHTIFETGQNTRGYVHKLECHGQAIEFIYAVTDIVYGVMLPTELDFGEDTVTAEPARVRMFYVRAGEVIALHPYVLHSGSLSVEPDRSFSILIYKKPATGGQPKAELPRAWAQRQDCLKIAGVDKFYLTLEELHTDDLKTNRGFVAGKRPVRLPTWER